jgi:nitroreductase
MNMNETLKVIRDRRSIKQYGAEQIPDPELQQILEAAIYAPNAMNQQKWHFTVIQDKDMLDKMVGIIKENIMNSGIEFLIERASAPGYNTFHNAPTVVFVTGDEKAKFMEISCGAAAQNIALAAASLNIGSCVMTSPEFLFSSDKGNALKKELGIPDGYNFMCAIALGYTKGEKPPTPPRSKDVINYIK